MKSALSGGLLVALLLLGCNDERGIDLERMIDQHKYQAYEKNSFFADGRSMRRPPEGAIQYQNSGSSNGTDTGFRGDRYLEQIPINVDRALLERGRNRFQIYCATCHGELGNGQSQVAENMTRRPPPSFHVPPVSEFPVGRLYRVIREGYGFMPSYADALNTRDRWAVVAYIEALRLSQSATLPELPSEVRAEATPWLK